MVEGLSIQFLLFTLASILVGLVITGFLIDGFFVILHRKWKQFIDKGNIASRGKKAYRVSVHGYDSFIFQGMPNLLHALGSRATEMKGICQRGYCGACKFTVLSGHVRWIIPPGIKLRENEILACCCIPQSDLLLSKTRDRF